MGRPVFFGFILLILAQHPGCRVGFEPPCREDIECDDRNPCTNDLCRPPFGCLHEFNTAPCDDGDLCSSRDSCSEGTCLGGQTDLDGDSDGYLDGRCSGGDDCDDDNAGVNPGADESLGSGGCDDSLDNDCDGRTDREDVECLDCTDDSDCDDSDACTGSEFCLQGTCFEGEPLLCDDGLFCNGAETCDALSGCVAGSPPCSGLCDEIEDRCANCGDGLLSIGEECDPGAPRSDNCCDVGSCLWVEGSEPDPQGTCGGVSVCQVEACDGAGGCAMFAVTDGRFCDDGLYCNGTDTCMGGTCSAHTGDPCPPQVCIESDDSCSDLVFPFALGQQSLTDSVAVDPPTDWSLRNPVHMSTDGTRFALADRSNSRVLIWNSIPQTMAAPADIVIGQPDFVSRGINVDGTVTDKSLYYPFGVDFCEGRLVIADSYNHRVLIFNSVPSTSYPSADLVLGQPDMSSNLENAGGTATSQTFHRPVQTDCHSGRLFVADIWNHRVLIWNSFPTFDQQPADIVLGQVDMESSVEDSGGVSASSMDRPHGLYVDADRLMVADHDNSRLLIWNTLPTVSFTPADLVIGQPDFTGETANNGGVGASSLNYIVGTTVSGSRLYVADKSNNRVLIWDSFPTVSGQPADRVYGQPDFTSNAVNGGGADPSGGFNNTQGILVRNGLVYVTEWNNNRALVFLDP